MAQLNELKRMQFLAGIIKEGQLNEALAKTYKVIKTAKEGNSHLMDGRWKVGDMLALQQDGNDYKLSTKDDIEQTYDGQSLESLIRDKFIEPVNITESQLNEEGMTLPIKNFLKMGEDEFKVNFVKFTNNSAGHKGFGGTRNDGSFPVSVETDIKGKGPDGKFVINAYVTKEGNLDHIFLPGYDDSETLVKQVKDWGALRNYITSELAKTKPAAEPQAESIEQAVNEALKAYRKKK